MSERSVDSVLAKAEDQVRLAMPRVNGDRPYLFASFEWHEDQGEYGWEVEFCVNDRDRNVIVWRPTLEHALTEALNLPCTCPDVPAWEPDWDGTVEPADPSCPYHGLSEETRSEK